MLSRSEYKFVRFTLYSDVSMRINLLNVLITSINKKLRTNGAWVFGNTIIFDAT